MIDGMLKKRVVLWNLWGCGGGGLLLDLMSQL